MTGRQKVQTWQLSEEDFQRAVIDTARAHQYRIAHFRAAATAKGFRTPVEADGAGFPDLVLVGRGRIIVAELKRATGTVSAAQTLWLEAFRGAGVETYVWRPVDLLSLPALLRDRRAAQRATTLPG